MRLSLRPRAPRPKSKKAEAPEFASILKTIDPVLEDHDPWAREGAELAQKYVYLDGELKLGRSAGRNTAPVETPEAPVEYPAAAGKLAGEQVGKGGVRLADQLKKLFP